MNSLLTRMRKCTKNDTKSTAVLNCVRIHVKRLEKDGEINMKKWIRFCSLLMAAMLLFTAMPLAAAAAADADAPVDFVLVLDCSASIFQNDTQRLSINAVQSFIDQMPVQNARVGVIGFGYRADHDAYAYSSKYSGASAELDMRSDASHVHEIMPISALSTSKDREAFKQSVVEAVNKGYESASADARTHTDGNPNQVPLYSPVVPALAAAVDMLEKNGSEEKNACIILVTDGISYTHKSGTKADYDPTPAGKQAGANDWPIYCIELNYNTHDDKEIKTAETLLDAICAASGERYVSRENCEEPKHVFIAFQKIFYDLWKNEPIPEGWPQEMTLPGEFSFSVPVLTSEATVNVFGSNVTSVTLTDPSGNKTQLDRDQDGNDLIAVFKDNYCSIKMICPKDGQWTCHVEGTGSASVLINSTDLQEMGLAIVANAASGNTDNLAKNDEIHVSSYFAYKGHEIHNHSIYEQTHENAILRVRHSNGQTGEYKMEANEQGYFCDIKLNDFPCGTLDLQVVLTDGMFRNNEKRSETVTFKTIAQPLELIGNGPSDTLEAYVNSQFRDISLPIIFKNPDGDVVTYGLECITDSRVHFDFDISDNGDYMMIKSGMIPGTYDVALTAKDPDMTEPLTFMLKVNVTDRELETKKIPKVELWVDHFVFQKKANATATIDLSQYFTDPDGVEVTYTQTVDDSSIASVSLENGILTITPNQKGNTVVTVTGFDGVSYKDAQIKVSVISAKAAFWRDNWIKFVIAAALIVLIILILIFISKNTRVKGVWNITFEENSGIPVTANNVKISTMSIGRKKVFLLKDLLGALAKRLDGDVAASLPKYFGSQKPAAQIELKGVLFGKGFIVRKIPKDETVQVLYGGIAKQGKVQVRGTVKFVLRAPGQLGTDDTLTIVFK